jgi:hypothetical protein
LQAVRKILSIFILLQALAFAHEARAQTNASNLESLQMLLAKIAAAADSMIDKTGAMAVHLEPRAVAAQSPERLLYTSLVQAVAHDARRLFAPGDSSGEQKREGLFVKSKIVTCEIIYRKLRRPGWFRPRPIERTIKVAVDFDLHDAQTRRIYFQGVLAATQSDTLKGNVNQLEDPALPFTLGAWQKNENRAAWLEPALLTAATGAIVYAFYSLRSQ